jgi:hypothetical protein
MMNVKWFKTRDWPILNAIIDVEIEARKMKGKITKIESAQLTGYDDMKLEDVYVNPLWL